MIANFKIIKTNNQTLNNFNVFIVFVPLARYLRPGYEMSEINRHRTFRIVT